MPAPHRTTSSGACCSCGAYGGSQHRPTCQPEGDPLVRFQLGHMRGAERGGRISAAALAYETLQRVLSGDF